MLEVYKFWGIGVNFSKMLNLITTGRNATIIFDDGSLSRQFQLETGAPQGNSPSPLQYNFCEQIAILKLELEPRIASIYNHHLIPRNQVPPILGPNVLPQAPVPDPVPLPVPVPALRPDPPIEFLPGVANVNRFAAHLRLRINDPFALFPL